jgi:flagellar protein FliO/FliZ
VNPTDGLGALLWFVAVLAAIPLVLWLLRRSPLAAGTPPGAPRSVAVLPLAGAQRLVTVEVGQGESRRWLVLGVTPHSISTLHTMEPQAAPALPGATPSAAFSQLLQRLRQDGRGGDAR